jgi:hypothetical protein
MPERFRGSRAAVTGTSGKGTAANASAEERDDAPKVPPTSPLVEEVSPGHPMREAIETAAAERQAGRLGRPGKPLYHRSPVMIGVGFFIAAGLDNL